MGKVGAAILFFATVLTGPALAQRARIRPPETLGCPRDWLTAFTGKVLSYSRDDTRLVLRMRTDEDTAERFVLRFARGEDPARWFLLRAEPFKAEDWARIESAARRLRPNMRATVWVCKGRANPVVDWQPPR